MEEIIDKVIMEAYIQVLINSSAPSITMIYHKFKDLVDREAYNITYHDINFNIREEAIDHFLNKYRCIHSSGGCVKYDAQNILFPNWLPHLKLLRLSNG